MSSWCIERAISFLKLTMLCTLVPMPALVLAKPLKISVRAESALLMNADTGAILYEKNSRTLRHPASITKIATALYAFRVASDKMDKKFVADHDAIASISDEARKRSNYTLPAYWLVPDGAHIGIKKGEELALRDLLFGMLVASGNDAANVIAQNIGGTIPNFMNGVNACVKELGCTQTTFYNPHGLFHPKHQTTAYDMALIMREALKIPTFREIIATVRYKRPKTNKQESTTLVQTNRLIKKGKYYYAKALGGKTGRLSVAGNTLVVAAKDQDRTLIAVLLKSEDRGDIFTDAIKMFEAAFNESKVQRVLLKAGPQKFTTDLPGSTSSLTTYLQSDVTIEYYPAEEPQLKCMLYWDELSLPITKDQRVGELRLQTPEGRVVKVVPLFAQEDVSSIWFWSIRRLFG